MSRTRNRQPMVHRMARIEGHVRAVREMLVSDRDCPEILIQLAAIRAALDGVARLVFEDHMDSCIVDAVETGNAEAKIAEIKTAFAQYFI
ncbi:DNA-binding transcriptional regulator, FrmR family [Sulfobacillus thermosulfidooxidans DSM 9293]|uniref:DNA-binding transcriptional regulator, FrmR family n=1 Tax=Sulfobacillus thermosulfidooxidans (strain DSM 9293 / VKM B-1269 / AT-1) TaxID=929705 RepID=A0A1W1WPI2_SULTA|nr:metal-sensing transcriptional repressor [Sulfobacillus thermosulfidooxidans]SMC08125.1 DNA-binding transcriptional regulator, FrmR family [Sulfobacillus thermosulfidooxidans DSM 9293]